MKRCFISFLVVGLSASFTSAAVRADAPAAWMNASLTADQRADALVAAMTRDEKLIMVFGYFGSFNLEKKYNAPVGARAGSAGFIPGIPRLGVPAQYQTDAGLGVSTQVDAVNKRGRTALPSGIATAATWNPMLAYMAGAMIGDEARRSGFNVMLAGGVNLMRDPRNGRNFEYAGEDPLLAGTIVGAEIAGVQSNNIISTLKHFAINDQETARHTSNSVIDRVHARMSDLLAFQIAMEKGEPGAVMCAYNLVNNHYACENRWLLTDVLRKNFGFKGYVMSDWGAVHSTRKAIMAGLDQQSGWPLDDKAYFGPLLRQELDSRDVSEVSLNLMVRRIVYAMFRHGLFEHPIVESPIDFVKHGKITRQDAEEGIVLLKNRFSILPLSSSVRSIVVIGGHADKGVLSGSGSSLVYPVQGNAVPGLSPQTWPGPVMYFPSSPLDEIRRQAPNARISFVDGQDAQAAARAARENDVAIVFGTQWSAEDIDVKYSLDDNQDKLVTAVASSNPRTVVVLETNSGVSMPWIDQVGAVLMAWYPGTQGGAAIANLIFGKANPSGHLPITIARSVDQLPRPKPPVSGDVRYTEGANIGYKWFDYRSLKPLFPFGFGLSYTRFRYEGVSVRQVKNRIIISFRVRNVGRAEGATVPQIYVSREGWQGTKRLCGFTKVALSPGAEKTVSITIYPRILANFVASRNSWRIAAGRYRIMLATSSRDIVHSTNIRLNTLNIIGQSKM